MCPFNIHHTHVLAVWQAHTELFDLGFQIQEDTTLRGLSNVLEEFLDGCSVERDFSVSYCHCTKGLVTSLNCVLYVCN